MLEPGPGAEALAAAWADSEITIRLVAGLCRHVRDWGAVAGLTPLEDGLPWGN